MHALVHRQGMICSSGKFGVTGKSRSASSIFPTAVLNKNRAVCGDLYRAACLQQFPALCAGKK